MLRDVVAVALKRALQRPGCPICRVRADSELRYMRALLWEYVNDPVTRDHFIASLGYCPTHTWQLGLLEKERFGVPLGNAILYEHLTGVLRKRLADLARSMTPQDKPRWQRWLTTVRPQGLDTPGAASPLEPQALCRVCQMGEQAEARHLEWLLRGLSEQAQDFRDWYAASDGLCLRHLRQGLALHGRAFASGKRFLAEVTAQRLAVLQRDLSEFDRKNAWERRDEGITEAEQGAWLRALAFYGGSREEGSADD